MTLSSPHHRPYHHRHSPPVACERGHRQHRASGALLAGGHQQHSSQVSRRLSCPCCRETHTSCLPVYLPVASLWDSRADSLTLRPCVCVMAGGEQGKKGPEEEKKEEKDADGIPLRQMRRLLRTGSHTPGLPRKADMHHHGMPSIAMDHESSPPSPLCLPGCLARTHQALPAPSPIWLLSDYREMDDLAGVLGAAVDDDVPERSPALLFHVQVCQPPPTSLPPPISAPPPSLSSPGVRLLTSSMIEMTMAKHQVPPACTPHLRLSAAGGSGG